MFSTLGGTAQINYSYGSLRHEHVNVVVSNFICTHFPSLHFPASRVLNIAVNKVFLISAL